MLAYWIGYGPGVAALVVHPAWLAGNDLRQFFAMSRRSWRRS